jgi:hypothetical protein
MVRLMTERVTEITMRYHNGRRNSSERRDWHPARFPLIDSHGDVSHVDRHQQADRRGRSILVQEI